MPSPSMTKKKNQAQTSTQVSKQGAASNAKQGAILQKLDAVLTRIPKGTFKNVGGAVGAKLGPAGAAAGSMLGAGLSAITGYGDYTVRGNSLGTVSTSTDMVPQFVARREGDHSTRIRHREYLFDLKVPETPLEFSNNFVQNINPGNPRLFPWLSKMAKLYTQYRIHGMVLVYKTMSSNYSASGGPLGTVIMATNYNVNDVAFGSKVQMENTEFAVSTDPSRNIVHAIECDPKSSGLQTLYIRDPETADLTQTSDNRFFDFGKFQIATTGLPGASGAVMGEVWCSYDIELIKPVIGDEETPTPGPTPILTNGNVLVSQSNGSTVADVNSAFQLGSVGDEVYRNGGPSATGITLSPDVGVTLQPTYSGSAIFADAPGNVSPVVKLLGANPNAGSELRIFRNGVYVVQVFCRFKTTVPSSALVNGLAFDAAEIYAPTITNTTGVTAVVLGSSPQAYVPHAYFTGGPASGQLPSGGATLYDCGLYQTSFILRVSGLPSYDSTKYSSVILPYSGSFDAANSLRGFARTLNVGWLSSQVLPVEA